MDLGLKNKVVLISGSSRGIGRATAGAFLSEGSRMVITGRDLKSVKATTREFEKKFSRDRVLSVAADLTKEAGIKKCVRKVISTWGRIDILVANIGSGSGKSGLEAKKSDWERMFNINLFGSVGLVKEVAPIMQKNKSGSIIFISSIAGIEALGAPLAYSVAKAGIIAFSKSLSQLLARDNIRVNAVAPGNIFFEGGVWDRKIKENSSKIKRYIKNNVAMQRFGKPEEIADVVLFLASSRASFITGACLVADGGQIKKIL